jgi:cytochrome c peroxidase
LQLTGGNNFLDKSALKTTYLNSLTSLENQGKQLYSANCAKCHGIDFDVVEIKTANNGLQSFYKDKGIYEITKDFKNIGEFKVPTLRNIGLTAPYMHDGSLATLDEVIDHYNSGIVDHENLHFLLKGPDNKPKKLNLTQLQKSALKAFLLTATNEDLKTDIRFSNPFKI